MTMYVRLGLSMYVYLCLPLFTFFSLCFPLFTFVQIMHLGTNFVLVENFSLNWGGQLWFKYQNTPFGHLAIVLIIVKNVFCGVYSYSKGSEKYLENLT